MAHPSRLGKYRITEVLGEGAMGVVYKAFDPDIQRTVALKTIREAFNAQSGDDSSVAARFRNEAVAAGRLTHPGIVAVYDFGQDEGTAFIAMEFVEGKSLAQHLSKLSFSDEDVAGIMCQLLDALHHAHEAGVWHRDVKPANVILASGGRVKVADFGIARIDNVALTQARMMIGTPTYMAPEQFLGTPIDRRVDIYAAGVLLYILLVGRPPFMGTQDQLFYKAVHEAPVAPSKLARANRPLFYDDIVLKALAKDPAQRFATAAEFRQAIEHGVGQPFDTAAWERSVAQPVPRQPDASNAQAGGSSNGPSSSPPPPRHTAAPTPATVLDTPPRAAAPPRGNLPQQATSFIGREALRAQALEQLAQTRLLTLTGPGGTGKTRLSLHLAAAVAHDFVDGVWLAELAVLAPGQDIVSTVAGMLGVAEVPGRNWAEVLTETLATKSMLLVLDNCEHVADATAALAARLLAACPGVRLLASSRQPLVCPGERAFAVPPLSAGSADASLDDLARAEAVRLFADRAQAVRSSFTLGADNVADVARICRRLDGIPLAIELAAARVKVLSLSQIAARLDDVFHLLTGGHRTQLPRQQTLRALIDWSHDMLGEVERRVFARLSVFPGDFDLEAAEAVAAGDGVDASAVLDAVSELVDKSLLVAVEHEAGMRYHLLLTIRQYAAEKLAVPAESRRRHAEYFAALFGRLVEQLDGPDHGTALALLKREHANACAALDAVVAERWIDIGARLGPALAAFWDRDEALADGVARFETYMPTGLPEDA